MPICRLTDLYILLQSKLNSYTCLYYSFQSKLNSYTNLYILFQSKLKLYRLINFVPVQILKKIFFNMYFVSAQTKKKLHIVFQSELNKIHKFIYRMFQLSRGQGRKINASVWRKHVLNVGIQKNCRESFKVFNYLPMLFRTHQRALYAEWWNKEQKSNLVCWNL